MSPHGNLLHARASWHHLVRARRAVFLLCAIMVILVPVRGWHVLPEDIFAPVGLLRIADTELLLYLIRPLPLSLLQIVAVGGCLALAALRTPPRFLLLSTPVVLLIVDGLVKSFGGFINHAQMGPLYVAILFALIEAFSTRSTLRSARVASAALTMVSLALAIPYSLLGMHRVVKGGAEMFLSDTILALIGGQSLAYSAYGYQLGAELVAISAATFVFKLGFGAITLLEILSPLAVVNRMFRWTWLVAMVPFHLSTLFLMNIFFWENIVLILLLFTPLLYLDQARKTEALGAEARVNPAGRTSRRPSASRA